MKKFRIRARADLRMRKTVFVRLHVFQTSTQILGEPHNLTDMINRKIVLEVVETRQFQRVVSYSINILWISRIRSFFISSKYNYKDMSCVEWNIKTVESVIKIFENVWRQALSNCENSQQDALYRLIYYSKSGLHVSGHVFAHHQEHLTIFTVSDSVHPSCCRLPTGSKLGEHYQIL
jgi:hypothetical protein